jgi:hypothetical protein
MSEKEFGFILTKEELAHLKRKGKPITKVLKAVLDPYNRVRFVSDTSYVLSGLTLVAQLSCLPVGKAGKLVLKLFAIKNGVAHRVITSIPKIKLLGKASHLFFVIGVIADNYASLIAMTKTKSVYKRLLIGCEAGYTTSMLVPQVGWGIAIAKIFDQDIYKKTCNPSIPKRILLSPILPRMPF